MDRSAPLLFQGSATALITPFSDGKIDFDCFANLVEINIRNGADALVVAGTTGEASTLSPEEQQALCTCAVQVAAGRVPVIGGAGSNDTAHACDLARLMCRAGCDGLLCVTPYYNKATPRGMELHFQRIAEASEKPIILYNVPSRTGCEIPLSAYEVLAKHPNICGVKEASGDIVYASHVIARYGSDMPLYSGCDRLTLPLLSLGAQGVISVVANIIPSIMHALCQAWFSGDVKAAARAQLGALSLMEASMSVVNPIPIKTACAMMGLCKEEMRLPLCPMLPAQKHELSALLSAYGLTE